MFLLNVGYQWGILDEGEVSGAVFSATGQDLETAARRTPPQSLDTVLFDPQLYLVDYALEPEDYPSLLVKLCTYPWFCANAPGYDSGEGPRRDWLTAIRGDIADIWSGREDAEGKWDEVVSACIGFQERFGCTSVILPSRLLADPEDSLDEYFIKLDEALAIAGSMTELPILASVPIDERLVAHRDPGKSEIVEALADGLTAREAVSSVYITVSRESSPAVQIVNPKVAGAVLRLCSLLSSSNRMSVTVNYLDSLGVAALGFGATAYGSGFSQKARCLRLGDYRDRDGGAAYPKFTSFRMGLDFYPDPDLDKLRNARLLRYLDGDRTKASTSLLDALASGHRASSVAQWAQRKNNVAAAKTHYIQLHERVSREKWNPGTVHAWLQDAESKWVYLAARFEDDPLDVPNGKHLAPWRRAVEDLLP